jgi:putative ABC transport system substrate-binding protein
MQRRQFITLLGVASAAWPLHGRAQAPSALLRVGIVSVATPRNATPYVQLDQRLRELGYVERQNFALEFISLNGQLDRYGEAMKELVRRKVDIIIAFGTEIALKGAIAATDTLPIVMVAVDYDPLASGYVASLAHPGGRITGVFLQQIDLAVKRAQLMKDAFPDMRAATVFWDRISEGQWQAMQSTARNLGLQLEGVELRQSPYDYEQAIVQVSTEWRKTLFIGMSPNFFADRARLAEFAMRHRIASISGFREFVVAGGALSYGPSFASMARRAAEFVDRIAKGTKPADLPVELPTKFELVVNLNTARTIGVEIPLSILLRADEVIE